MIHIIYSCFIEEGAVHVGQIEDVHKSKEGNNKPELATCGEVECIYQKKPGRCRRVYLSVVHDSVQSKSAFGSRSSEKFMQREK